MSTPHSLIVIEGIDGVGKTTLCRELTLSLQKSNFPVVWFEEVEEASSLFNRMKKTVRTEASLEAQFYFYLASAIYKSSIIEDLLEKQTVICDRFVYSTYAYHLAKGLNVEYAPMLSKLPIRKPDLAYQLILDETERQKRILQRPDNDIDDFEFKKTGGYIDIFEKHLQTFQLKILDTSLSTDELVHTILADLNNL